MNWGNLWIGFIIRPYKVIRSLLVSWRCCWWEDRLLLCTEEPVQRLENRAIGRGVRPIILLAWRRVVFPMQIRIWLRIFIVHVCEKIILHALYVMWNPPSKQQNSNHFTWLLKTSTQKLFLLKHPRIKVTQLWRNMHVFLGKLIPIYEQYPWHSRVQFSHTLRNSRKPGLEAHVFLTTAIAVLKLFTYSL